ncbi:MAG: helical backbone metal receptor [Balneolaceae bacterium]
MTPQRIVSLVPSLTELIADLDLASSLAGRTRFCKHPDHIAGRVPIVGGTKNPRLDKIREINPDMIIANVEENRKEDIDGLKKDYPVYLTDIHTIEDALLTIHEMGVQFNAGDRAAELIEKINEELDGIPDEEPRSVTYFIWRAPWMTVGSDTYIHSVLERWKLTNVFGRHNRYPKVELSDVSRMNPDFILLSSEPYPFREKHKNDVFDACPDSNILLVDGEWFSWYGSRMLPSFKKLNTFRKAIS